MLWSSCYCNRKQLDMFVVIKLFNYLCRGGHDFTLFICLSVSSFTQKLLTRSEYFTREREMHLWTRKSPLNFGSHRDSDPDLRILQINLYHCGIGATWWILNFADNSISCQILMIFWGVRCLTRNKPFDFGVDLDHYSNSGNFKINFTTLRQGNFVGLAACCRSVLSARMLLFIC